MTLIVLSLFLLSSNTSGVIAQTQTTQTNDGQTEQQPPRDWIVPGNELVARINALAVRVLNPLTESTTSLESLIKDISELDARVTSLNDRLNLQSLSTPSILDVDENGSVNKTDGGLIVRYFLSIRGPHLTSNFTRTAPSIVAANISRGVSTLALDVDESGSVDINDGLIIVRYLNGARDANLTLNFTRTASSTVAANIEKLMPSSILTIPIGTIAAFNLRICPTGWSEADGAYSKPDLRGAFIRGLNGDQNDRDVARSLGGYQDDLFDRHGHFVASKKGARGGWDSLTANNYVSTTGPGNGNWQYRLAYRTKPAHVGKSSLTGGTETRPKNVALLYCVRR